MFLACHLISRDFPTISTNNFLKIKNAVLKMLNDRFQFQSPFRKKYMINAARIL